MRKLIVVTGLLFNIAVSAIQLSDSNEGDALIIPFYTVENDHKSVLTISNNTNAVKAVKVIVNERFLDRETFIYSVYMAPMLSYQVEINAATSTYPSHVGEPSSSLLSITNNTCTPFLVNLHPFMPFHIDIDVGYDTNMDRAQSGTIVVIDMGEVVDPEAQHILLNDSVPNNCLQIRDNWMGIWYGNSDYSMSEINGGLQAGLKVVDLHSLAEFNIAALAVNDTFNNEIYHNTPGDIYPNLRSVGTESNIEIEGQLIAFDWKGNNTNYITTLLQKTSISSSFDFTESFQSQINWVVSIVNKQDYIYKQTYYRLPFLNQINLTDQGSCDELLVEVRDELGVLLNPLLNQNFSLCEAVNVVPIKPFGELPELILDDSYRSFINVGHITKGSITLKTKPENVIEGYDVLNPAEAYFSYGLPMMGFQLTRLDDGINPVEYQKQEFTATQKIVADLIFADGVE